MKRLMINSKECIGCDLCVDLCPKLFDRSDFVPIVSDEDVTNNQCARDVIDFCPTNAISILLVF